MSILREIGVMSGVYLLFAFGSNGMLFAFQKTVVMPLGGRK